MSIIIFLEPYVDNFYEKCEVDSSVRKGMMEKEFPQICMLSRASMLPMSLENMQRCAISGSLCFFVVWQPLDDYINSALFVVSHSK